MAESPLQNLDCNFPSWLQNKKSEVGKHKAGKYEWDYSYPMDLELRKTLENMHGFVDFAKHVTSTIARQEIDKGYRSWLAVGPNQFPEVYDLGRDCAKHLGIGIPSIFITNSDDFNAYTIASDDIDPIIVIHNLLLERYSLPELKCIIAHECGHIHNYHSVFTMMSRILTNGALIGGAYSGLARLPLSLLSMGANLTLNMWSRAAEVTADRAALICCDDVEDAFQATGRLSYGAVRVEDRITSKLDTESLREQLRMTEASGSKYMESLYNHPITTKRVFAQMEFAESEVFYSWRPDLLKPGVVPKTRSMVDNEVKNIIKLNGKGKADGNK
ncbi:Peptidase family M48 [Butyrivibrio fibrisolvens DSM 3071]|uniref:Peptidase family M48 n=1 Tax=Butyrivibrio fibrisolvens DSM 3071 TaxID=1121131 RepID=A0A1M5WR52_BUTFI|nr:M48 family metallopeptidase [Butyrivibrio fibrisolvens]SHH89979.1 Peptidase family M48 [Butyrivibrio fibrisolvens DSM 3071]